MIEGRRKWSITVLYLLICVGLVVWEKIPGADFLQYTSYVILAYMGGNLGEWIAKRKS